MSAVTIELRTSAPPTFSVTLDGSTGPTTVSPVESTRENSVPVENVLRLVTLFAVLFNVAEVALPVSVPAAIEAPPLCAIVPPAMRERVVVAPMIPAV